jgi:hypothetical protein
MARTSKNVRVDAVDAPSAAESRRWVALGFIAASQLMVALDDTIVSIALPTIQAELGISDADRQWVVIAYTLAFGGLLLLGGRIADAVGGGSSWEWWASPWPRHWAAPPGASNSWSRLE